VGGTQSPRSDSRSSRTTPSAWRTGETALATYSNVGWSRVLFCLRASTPAQAARATGSDHRITPQTEFKGCPPRKLNKNGRPRMYTVRSFWRSNSRCWRFRQHRRSRRCSAKNHRGNLCRSYVGVMDSHGCSVFIDRGCAEQIRKLVPTKRLRRRSGDVQTQTRSLAADLIGEQGMIPPCCSDNASQARVGVVAADFSSLPNESSGEGTPQAAHPGDQPRRTSGSKAKTCPPIVFN